MRKCNELLREELKYAEALKIYLKRMQLSLDDEDQSEASRQFLANMLRMRVPVGDDSNLKGAGHSGWEPSWVWDFLTELQAPFYKSYPLAARAHAELSKRDLDRSQLAVVVNETTAGRLRPVYFDELSAEWKRNQTSDVTIGKDGNLGWAYFFKQLAEGKLPVFDHHDLVGHLALWSVPAVARATTQLATLVDRTTRASLRTPFSYHELLKMVWFNLQETVWFFDRTEKGELRAIIPVGGFTSLDTSRMAVADYAERMAELGPLDKWTIMSLVYFYEQVYHLHAPRKGPRVAALRASLEGWGMPSGLGHVANNRRYGFMENLQKEMRACVDQVKDGKPLSTHELVQEGMAACWSERLSKHAYLRQFETLETNASFWQLHLDALEEMIFE